QNPRLSAAACLSSVLGYLGRPVPSQLVAESCTDSRAAVAADEPVPPPEERPPEVPPEERRIITKSSRMRGARTFGLTLRSVEMVLDDLRYVQSPMLIGCRDGRFIVGERWSGGHFLIMDPATGPRSLSRKQARAELSQVAFQVSEVTSEASLGQRLV